MVDKKQELLDKVEKVIYWINSEIYNYKNLMYYFSVINTDNNIIIVHEDIKLFYISYKTLKVENKNVELTGYVKELEILYKILKDILNGCNVIYTKIDKDYEYSLYNVFIFDRVKFKNSKYVNFYDDDEDNDYFETFEHNIIEQNIVDVFYNNTLLINDKFKLGFYNKIYVEDNYLNYFEQTLDLINDVYSNIENRIKNVLEEYTDIKFKDIVVKYSKDDIFMYTDCLDLVYNVEKDLITFNIKYKLNDIENLDKNLNNIKKRIKEII